MITKRQYSILSFYMTRALFLGGGLSLLVGLSKNDLLFSGLMGLLLGYFILFLLFKYNNINKYVLIISATLVLCINTLANSVLTSTYLLRITPTILILLMFIGTLLYSVRKEFTIIGRVSELVIYVSFIEIVLAVIGLVPLVKIDNMLPLFSTKFISILKGIIVFTGASLLPNVLLINYKGDLKFKDIHIGYIVGSLLMILVLFLIISIYGSEFASITRFPEFLMLKKIDILGYFNNVENILVTEWMINILICALVCMKVIKDNCSKIWFYILIISIFLVNEFVFNKSYVNILYVKEYFYYISFILCISCLFIKNSKNC